MAVVVKAKRLRTTDDPPEVRRRLRIADKGADRLGSILFDGFAALRDRIDDQTVGRAMLAYDYRIVADQLDTVTFAKAVDPAELAPISDVLSVVAFEVAVAEFETMFGGAGGGMRTGFNVVNPRAVAWAQQHAAELMSNVLDESRLAIRQIMARALAGRVGASAPRDTAALIRHTIGLNPRQVVAVGNFRAGLLSAIENGGTPAGLRGRWSLSPIRYPGQMSPDRVEEFVRQYADRQLKYRSMMVARTETIRAASAGQQLSWEQMIGDGYLSPTVRKVWMATASSRTCPVCAALDGQTVGVVGGEFRSTERGVVPSERVAWDGPTAQNPPIHPHCRCTVVLEPDGGGATVL